MPSDPDPQPDAALIDAVRQSLLEIARQGTPVTYRDLAGRAGTQPPHRIHRITLALEALIREDHAAGRPLLACFAVSRAREGLPGRGFFELLRALGRYDGPLEGAPAEAIFRSELAAARGAWGGLRRKDVGP